ncbi:hypothetical protein K502DRAFT_363232 [Neoconidiobolus thromboides FSU 785]|nr:hypothetical protein K502DRAFT_363232 [Neoconidiobolus thromboides FSU 785]
MTSTEWTELTKESKKLTREIELKLSSINQFYLKKEKEGEEIGSSNSNFNEEEEMEKIKQKMEQLDQSLTIMEQDLSLNNNGQDNRGYLVKRSREKYINFSRQLERVSKKAVETSTRNELFLNKKPLSARERLQGIENENETDYFLGERGVIDNSYEMTDATLNQAFAIRNELSEQGHSILNSTNRVGGLINSLPSINGIINRISIRRRRDTLILAFVIASGIFFLWFALF